MLWIAAIGVVIVTVTFWAASRRTRAVTDPLAQLSWREAFANAERISRSGRFTESIPYYRRAIQDEGASDWRTHYALALAIRTPSVRDTIHLGLRIPQMRSTLDRVGASREALAELDQASRHAHTAAEKALIARLRGEIFANWGFVWDPLVIYQAVGDDDPTGDCTRHAQEFISRMENPAGSSRPD